MSNIRLSHGNCYKLIKGVCDKNRKPLLTIEDIQLYILELEEENERLSKNQRYYKNGVFSLENDKETMSDMIDDYKSRIDKAIEYIEKNKQICMFADLRKEGSHKYDLECDADDLLEILKGGKNERDN